MNEKQYCNDCGSELISEKRPLSRLDLLFHRICNFPFGNRATLYNPRTGKKRTLTIRKCPRVRWFKWGHDWTGESFN